MIDKHVLDQMITSCTRKYYKSQNGLYYIDEHKQTLIKRVTFDCYQSIMDAYKRIVNTPCDNKFIDNFIDSFDDIIGEVYHYRSNYYVKYGTRIDYIIDYFTGELSE